ncbi:DUF6095 family protein [Geojedonia litorea]|uniref:DUF6095 family protein n=1 Tax=Geojedonia litorea TaxID=1268269 RepID=A0ABV9N1J1_9FLAO
METNKTNKEVLYKGLNTMGLSLVCMFAGPTLVYVALGDKENSLFYPILILGFLICSLAIYLGFKGIKTILDSMFKK